MCGFRGGYDLKSVNSIKLEMGDFRSLLTLISRKTMLDNKTIMPTIKQNVWFRGGIYVCNVNLVEFIELNICNIHDKQSYIGRPLL